MFKMDFQGQGLGEARSPVVGYVGRRTRMDTHRRGAVIRMYLGRLGRRLG